MDNFFLRSSLEATSCSWAASMGFKGQMLRETQPCQNAVVTGRPLVQTDLHIVAGISCVRPILEPVEAAMRGLSLGRRSRETRQCVEGGMFS